MTGTARAARWATYRKLYLLASWSPWSKSPVPAAATAQAAVRDPLADDDGPRYKLADYCTGCGKLDKEGAHARYYCPRCHEVTCGMKRHGEWIVIPHYRRVLEEKTRAGRPCQGGPIDPREDRAP